MNTLPHITQAILLSVVLLACADNCKSQENRKLDSLLCQIRQADQNVRERLIEHYQTGITDSIIFYAQKMQAIDQENQELVFNILDSQGWPKHLSETANNTIWLVIEHADSEAQKRYFPMVAEQANGGALPRSKMATMQDRILMHENKKQIYGTQTKTFTTDNVTTAYMWPIENPLIVDSLRVALDMGTMAEYLEILQEVQGCEFVWDTSLTPDDVNNDILRETEN